MEAATSMKTEETPEERRARLDRLNEQQRRRRKRKKEEAEAAVREEEERRQRRAERERERMARETPDQRESRLARVRGNSAQRRALKKLQHLVATENCSATAVPRLPSAASSASTQPDNATTKNALRLDTKLAESKCGILERMLDFQEKQRIEREAAVKRHLEFEENQRSERETAAKLFWEAASKLLEDSTSIPPVISTHGESNESNCNGHSENDPKAAPSPAGA